MFKEAFPANFRAYEDACKQKEVKVGKMFVTENRTFSGPRWIINFPTKKHWRQPSKLEWIIEGLGDLRQVRPGTSDPFDCPTAARSGKWGARLERGAT